MFEKLININSDYERYLSEKKIIYEKNEKEIEELEKQHALLLKQAKKGLEEEQQALNEKYKEVIKKREKFIKKIHDKSVFDVSVIGPALAKLISIYELEEYSFKKDSIYINKCDPSSGWYSFDFYYKYSAILANSSIEFLESFKEKKIFLSPTDRMENHIEKSLFLDFFEFNGKEHNYVEFYNKQGQFLCNGQYSYIKEFIDYLISKRMANTKNLNVEDELKIFLETTLDIPKKKIKY